MWQFHCIFPPLFLYLIPLLHCWGYIIYGFDQQKDELDVLQYSHNKRIAILLPFPLLGPACQDVKVLEELIEAGLCVARLNLAHFSADKVLSLSLSLSPSLSLSFSLSPSPSASHLSPSPSLSISQLWKTRKLWKMCQISGKQNPNSQARLLPLHWIQGDENLISES